MSVSTTNALERAGMGFQLYVGVMGGEGGGCIALVNRGASIRFVTLPCFARSSVVGGAQHTTAA